jgi:hypothetical protein
MEGGHEPRFEHHHREKDSNVIAFQIIGKELSKIRRLIMATKAEVQQAIADEKEQVLAGIEDLNKQIADLKDALANGTAVTPADLDDIVSAVHDIFVPAEKPAA